jgi:hypothetical protein
MKNVTLACMALVFANCVSAQKSGPPLSEPVDANVLNFPEVQTVDGTVSVDNFPQSRVSPFARSCVVAADACSIDLTDLAAMGEVHITHASGAALDVGDFASPHFGVGSALVLLPPTINSTDTGIDRDIVFSQSLDLIPVSAIIAFSEPDSSSVFFYLSGYVLGSDTANAAAAKDIGSPMTERQDIP